VKLIANSIVVPFSLQMMIDSLGGKTKKKKQIFESAQQKSNQSIIIFLKSKVKNNHKRSKEFSKYLSLF